MLSMLLQTQDTGGPRGTHLKSQVRHIFTTTRLLDVYRHHLCSGEVVHIICPGCVLHVQMQHAGASYALTSSVC